VTHVAETPNSIGDERIFTPDEIAQKFKMHRTTVQKTFIDEPGVIRYGHPRRAGRRRYFTLRIPAHVVERVFARMTVGDR